MKMKILLVNQPIGNRGDEAAYRALIKTLSKHEKFEIEVLLEGREDGISDEIINLFAGTKYTNVEYIKYKPDVISARLPYRSFLIPDFLTRICELLSPTTRRLISAIKKADLILCAPGGVCMGPYRNWTHIWYLYKALELGKSVAIYSRSFGPFREASKQDKLFKHISLEILRKLCFLSLRDSKSQEYAKQLGVHFTKSIDTTFLGNPHKEIPEEYQHIRNKPYVVFVPNELNAWHPDFENISPKKFERFYKDILKYIISRGLRVVMVPQTYKPCKRRDYIYFQKLASGYGENVIVVSDEYDSGIQQAIIRSSSIVVGARYHSIVFAINNSVPFVSLAYEHKMIGLPDLLGLNHMCYDLIEKGVDRTNIVIKMIENVLDRKADYKFHAKKTSDKATSIAEECLRNFLKKTNSL